MRKIKFDEYVKELHMKMKENSDINNQLELKFSFKYPCEKTCKSQCSECKWSFFDSSDRSINFEEYVKVLLKENCSNPLQFPKELKVFLFKMISSYVRSKKEQKEA